MSLEKRINGFVQLGLFLKQFETNEKEPSLTIINDKFCDDFGALIIRQKAFNGWFTKENVLTAINEIANSLTKANIEEWLNNYKIENNQPKSIGVIMAGNIPLVGFHDMLCVLITGNQIQAKLASNDNTLIKKISEILIFIEPSFDNKIIFCDRLQNFDGVIATGSNNTARYFEQYFGKYPHIIRKNRNSTAIINKDDGINELKKLGIDIFQYFGLGCRSVSKLYIPKNFNLDIIFEAIYDYKNVVDNNKYANNYDYNKAVYFMGNNKLLENGFLLLKEDESLASPVGVLNYEYYNSVDELEEKLRQQKDDLQCVVSSNNSPVDTLDFGLAQRPALNDYADGVDTIKFLLKLV